ncbi:hypothetical protein B0H19DRAFT_716308 [Mycena capillaripes]|nr:hypothetical protein B0H19DRAFT_716308 [Mycena capillaripes]
MVLTRRAYRAISRWLPNEVIIEIIQFTAKADQAALCRVSKLFHDLCLPILYREVHLKSYGCAAAFCSIIMKNPIRADAVRSIIAPDFDEAGFRLFPALRSLLHTPPQLIQRLEHLSVTIDEFDPFLTQCTFPHLVTCELRLLSGNSPPPDDLVVSFLVRHPTLTRIHLRNHRTLLQTSSPKIQLPNLQYYTGNAPLLLHLNANCLREASVRWFQAQYADAEKIIIALGSLTRASVPFRLSNEDVRHKPGLMDSLSRHMPHMQSLRLREVLDRPVWNEFENAITSFLGRFTQLAYLAIESSRPNPSVWQFEPENRIIVETWGNACPTLEACCFNGRAWRKVDRNWETFPIDEFRIVAGFT